MVIRLAAMSPEVPDLVSGQTVKPTVRTGGGIRWPGRRDGSSAGSGRAGGTAHPSAGAPPGR